VLWLPGTDHAGHPPTQMVGRGAEPQEGRQEPGATWAAKAFGEARVWEWKDAVPGARRIGEQQQGVGAASLDLEPPSASRWDPGLSKAVGSKSSLRLPRRRVALTYRARSASSNWDPQLQTAVSDDLEVEHEEKKGSLWHIAVPREGHRREAHRRDAHGPRRCWGDTRRVAVHPDDPPAAYPAILIGKTCVVGRSSIAKISDSSETPSWVSMEFGNWAR